jgi:hypothetical protein
MTGRFQGTIRVDRIEEPVLRDVAPGAELPEDWLATVMRAALHEWAEGIEPPPHTWDRIRRRIQALVPSLSLRGESGTRRRRDV